MRLQPRDKAAVFQLASTVTVSWCDLAGAGVRACLALQPPPGCFVRALELELDGSSNVERAFAADTGRTSVAELITFSDAAGAPLSSLILLLAPFPEEQQTAVAAATFAFCAGPRTLVLAGAMRMPSESGPDVRSAAFHCAPPPGLLPLSTSTGLSDGFAAAWVQLCRASGQPSLLLLAPGYRVRLPGSAADDEAVAVACRLAAALAPLLKCSFSAEAAAAQRARLAAWTRCATEGTSYV